ncbi:ribosome biogenesis GTPase YlqF [Candidatus Marinamargulisbacteria bacterium SCGC AG-343-D04]|nr:ribosome biogenesis GTPase YlqF [Candidatus Marinamargulisbacteria bacterium SCGC AG-343-D04]
MSQIHWFPGHMAKTIKTLKSMTSRVDIIIECCDARIPKSSRNPIINTLVTEKHVHIIVLSKIDLADPDSTKKWVQSLETECDAVIECNILKNSGIKEILKRCKSISQKKRQKKRFHISRVMICGIPNVGKSALINKMAKKKAAAVQNKPGVTKQTKGVMLDHFLELIDSPGILWPKVDTEETSIKLALTKAIKETLYNDFKLCEWLLTFLLEKYPLSISKRYKIDSLPSTVSELMDIIAQNMGWLTKNKEIHEEKTSRRIIEDFQKQRLGPISLE